MSTSPTVAITFAPRERTPNNENISAQQIIDMRLAMNGCGWHTVLVEYSPVMIADRLKSAHADVVFNLVYGYVNDSKEVIELQPDSAERLEQCGANCTGSPSHIQRLAQDKGGVGEQLSALGIRVPRLANSLSGDFVAIIKPRYGACQRGINVVHSRKLSEVVVEKRSEEYIVQEYIVGEEFSVAVLDRDRVIGFPPLKITYEAPDSAYPVLLLDRFPWRAVPDSEDRYGLSKIAVDIFKHLSMRDYARIDFKVDGESPVVLDVNALPNLHPEWSLFPKAAMAGGWSYDALLNQIAKSALGRITGR